MSECTEKKTVKCPNCGKELMRCSGNGNFEMTCGGCGKDIVIQISEAELSVFEERRAK